MTVHKFSINKRFYTLIYLLLLVKQIKMGNSKSASLITPSVLNKLIQNRAEFNKNYRLLEANTASITKDDQTKYER